MGTAVVAVPELQLVEASPNAAFVLDQGMGVLSELYQVVKYNKFPPQHAIPLPVPLLYFELKYWVESRSEIP